MQDPLTMNVSSWEMDTGDLVMGATFLLQTVFGILGNGYLQCGYNFYVIESRVRSIHFILKHLFVANSLVIVFKGVPQTMEAFHLKTVLSDLGCKLVFYVHRLSRGMSLATTCLLSVFQAITISPMNSRWADLKVKAPKYIVPTVFLCWVLNMLVNVIYPLYMTAKWNDKTITKKNKLGYCARTEHDKITRFLSVLLVSVPDVVFLGLMLWASVSMVFILHRHKQRVRHIQRTRVSSRSSPESRATNTILLLVTAYVSSYTVSSLFSIYMAVSDVTKWLLNMNALSNLFFPSASPFLLLNYDSTGLSLYSVCCRRNAQIP